MKFLSKGVMIGALLALISACTQQEVVEQPRAPMSTFSAVSTSNPDFKPTAPMTVAWAQPLIVADELSEIKVGAQTVDWIEANCFWVIDFLLCLWRKIFLKKVL